MHQALPAHWSVHSKERKSLPEPPRWFPQNLRCGPCGFRHPPAIFEVVHRGLYHRPQERNRVGVQYQQSHHRVRAIPHSSLEWSQRVPQYEPDNRFARQQSSESR